MHRDLLKPPFLTVAGLTVGMVYGLVQAFLAFVATGAGHGTYVFLGLSSSPISLTQSIGNSLLAIPIIWSVMGALAGLAGNRVCRALFGAAMLAHYAALPVVLGHGSNFGDWSYLEKVGGLTPIAFGVYAIGQAVLWGLFLLALWLRQGTARLRVRDAVLMLVFFVVLFVVPGLSLLGYFRSLHDKDYDFREENPAHGWTVQSIGTQDIRDMPRYEEGGGFDYRDRDCAFSPGPTFQCVHPRRPGGELCIWDRQANKVECEKIPQPVGFVPKYEFNRYFDTPALWVNTAGDQLIRWDLEGNGDHGLALRRSSTGSFTTARVGFSLWSSKALCSADGSWYLVVWHGNLPQRFEVSVYALDEKLHPTLVGTHHSAGVAEDVLDAGFSTVDTLHVVWGDIEHAIAPKARDNWLRLRTIDLDVRKGRWLNEQEIWRLDRSVGVAPALHIGQDGSTHYVWEIREGQRKSPASGLFYQAKGTGETLKLADNYNGFKSLMVGKRIVVCYTEEDSPDKVYFRVIQDGRPGPVASITLARPRTHALWGKYVVLGNNGEDSFWFVDTLDINHLYELKVVEIK
jgi:hypothetical protein